MSHERRAFADIPALAPDQPLNEAPLVSLNKNDSQHLSRVLRLRPGAQVLVVSRNSGCEYEAIITELGPPILAKLIRQKPKKSFKGRVHTLAFAISKNDKNDLVCQKACELGVQQIVFWCAQRSVVKVVSDSDSKKKLRRWNDIAEAAAKQSCQNFIAKVQIVDGIQALLSASVTSYGHQNSWLWCSLSGDAKPIREIPPPKGGVGLIVGPEGDFSPQEEVSMRQAGCLPISLGPFILRAETAALVAIAMTQGIWGNIGENLSPA